MLEYHLTAGGEKHWSTNYSGIGEKRVRKNVSQVSVERNKQQWDNKKKITSDSYQR